MAGSEDYKGKRKEAMDKLVDQIKEELVNGDCMLLYSVLSELDTETINDLILK